MITTNVDGNTISAGFISEIQSDSPNVIARLWYDGAELECDIVNITVQKGSCGQQTFMIGDVIGDILTATVKNLSADIKDQVIQCHIGAYVNGAYEYVSLGQFRVSEVKKTRYQAEITAYSSVVSDTGARFDTTGLNSPTLVQLASKVAGKLDCTVTFDAGIDTSLTVDAVFDGLTYYQVLQIIAICSGGYVVNTNDGNVKVRKFDTTPTLDVDTGMMVKLPKFAEMPYEVDSIGVMVSEATVDNEGNEIEEIFYSDNPNYIIATKSSVRYFIKADSGYLKVDSGNFLLAEVVSNEDFYLQAHNGDFILANLKPETADIYFSCPYMSEDIFHANLMDIKGYEYTPANVGLTLGDPRLEGCDVLNVEDVDGAEYIVPCHKIIHKYTGGFTSEITSCDASDHANNIGSTAPITQRLESQSRQIGKAQATAENAYKIAGDTNQYFWFVGSGSDTGAHITETPQEQFLEDPTNGGGNLLARSNGVAIRDGLEELAIFSASLMRLGQDIDGEVRTEITPNGMRIFRRAFGIDAELANIGYGLGNGQLGTDEAPYYTFGERSASDDIGNYSLAEGLNTTASAYGSHAEGLNTTASENGAHAEGDHTTASGEDAHAEGLRTTASETRSHAEGSYATASGDSSHAEGANTTASGLRSHAEGYYAVASGAMSHAGGDHTIADGQAQMAIGKYNVSDQTSLFIIGRGIKLGDTITRRNALQVDSYGNLRVKGKIYTGCNDDSTGGVLLKVLKVTASSVSSLPETISNSSITADMECIHSVLSNPNAQRGDWTVTTSAGSVEISGAISGTTNITLYLAEPST